jgi:hypothetical protein
VRHQIRADDSLNRGRAILPVHVHAVEQPVDEDHQTRGSPARFNRSIEVRRNPRNARTPATRSVQPVDHRESTILVLCQGICTRHIDVITHLRLRRGTLERMK